MADSVDIEQLMPEQKEALQTYTSVTDQDTAAALQLLQRSEWNVQIAITKFFDGERADPLEQARREAASVPRQSGSSGVLIDDLGTSSIRYRRPVQRPIGGRGPGALDEPAWRPSLLSILFSPFTLVYRILTSGFSLLRELWAGPPSQQRRQRPTIEDSDPQRQEQQARQDLRQEQESAYERSLAQDREKARLRKEAEARKAREEQRARDREQWRRWRASTIKPEPGSEMKNVSRISIRTPNGERLVRRFSPDMSIEELYAFVESHSVEVGEKVPLKPENYEHDYNFRLVSTMPRVVYKADAGTVASIGRSANLIVEPIEEDEEEEEEG